MGITGEGAVAKAQLILADLLKIAEDRPLTAQDVRYAVQLVAVGKNGQLVRLNGDVVRLLPEARKSHPDIGAKRYIDAMRQDPLFWYRTGRHR